MERWYRERKERRRKKRRREDLSAEVGSRQKQSRGILGSLLLMIFEYAVNRVDRERQEEVRSLERGVREKSIGGEDSRAERKEDEKVRVTWGTRSAVANSVGHRVQRVLRIQKEWVFDRAILPVFVVVLLDSTLRSRLKPLTSCDHVLPPCSLLQIH